MSGTIWLITEDESDAQAVQALLNAHGFQIRIHALTLTGGKGGISRLTAQLERLIKTAMAQKGKNDCIAVLHDADLYKEPDRSKYDAIESICRQYTVKHIVAHDELEAWLLADVGVSQWLGIPHKNWDTQKEPSAELNWLLKRAKGMKYRGRSRQAVLRHLMGENHSPSLKNALHHLDNAPCVR